MPDDSIMDMVNNIETLYEDKMALFSKWVDEGDVWGERQASREAHNLVTHFAEYLENSEMVRGRYSNRDVRDAVEEILEEFVEYREEELKARIKETTRVAKPEELTMDAGDIEHAKKYEELAQKLGIEKLKSLIPVSPEKIRTALERGDKYLNTIPLRKWDDAAKGFVYPGLSLSEKVSALKHVARWHYA